MDSKSGKLVLPSVAEMVASTLRARILSGEIPEGSILPKLDELAAAFPASRPSVRQAMRILETEGLIEVRRGNIGGSVVRSARPDAAAHMLGMVMQARGVDLADLAVSLQYLEPLCVRLVAGTANRAVQVIGPLQQLTNQAEEALEDGPAFTRLGRRFHDEIVNMCPVRSLVVLVGVFEALWDAHEESWADRIDAGGLYPEVSLRKAVLHAHRQILEAVGAGDAERAERLSQDHIKASQAHSMPAGTEGAPLVVDRVDPRLRALLSEGATADMHHLPSADKAPRRSPSRSGRSRPAQRTGSHDGHVTD
jgi:GntR family transcriptional regulator, transcriptional repressor for pyruvate dehydrogenase complex